MSRTVWIARHGLRMDSVDAEWRKNAERPYDPSLSDVGHVQARDLARFLAAKDIGHIFSSPFLRTLQTSDHVARAIGCAIKVEYGLCEFLPDLKTKPDLLSESEKGLQQFPIDPGHASVAFPTYPEAREHANQRAVDAVKHIAATYNDSDILIVGHGSSVAACVRGLVPTTGPVTTSLCCLFEIRKEHGEWSMKRRSDVSHLRNPKSSFVQVWTG